MGEIKTIFQQKTYFPVSPIPKLPTAEFLLQLRFLKPLNFLGFPGSTWSFSYTDGAGVKGEETELVFGRFCPSLRYEGTIHNGTLKALSDQE